MYSKAIQDLLKGIKPGNEVTVTTDGKEYKGVLMPRTELGDPNYLVLKLDNGYNVGLKHEKSMKIEKAKPVARTPEKPAVVKQNKSLPPISIMSTGGTIASKVDYKTGGVSPALTAEEIIEAVPELASIAYVKDHKTVLQVLSEDMLPASWKQLAEEVAKELNSGAEGIIITHGTDTMHYSAAALSFMLETPKPVVLVGSQRSTDRGSTDAAMNLICAAHVAKSDIAEVGTCMHATISDDNCFFIKGTKVRKMHTSRRDTFRPINASPIARVWPDGKIERLSDYKKRGKGKVKADTVFEEKTALIKAYPGSDPGIIDYLAGKGYKGIVVEATGLGHVPLNPKDSGKSWMPAVKNAIDKGVAVVFAAQTLYGRLNPYVYAPARVMQDLGVIYAEDMLPETAYVKLGWVLGHTTKQDKVKQMMLTNYAGEITGRSMPEHFLY